MALLTETFVQADVARQVLVIRIHLKIFWETVFTWKKYSSILFVALIKSGANVLSLCNGESSLTLELGIENMCCIHLFTQLEDKLIKAEVHLCLHFVKEKSFPGSKSGCEPVIKEFVT